MAPPAMRTTAVAAPVPSPELVDTSAFTLGRWSLKFTVRETERRYHRWQLENAVPYTRIGMIASVANWSAVLIGFGVSTPYFTTALFWILLFPIPVILFSLGTTYRRRMRAWVQPSTALANAVAGLTIVGLSFGLFGVGWLGMVGTVVVAFFGFTVFRLPTWLAMVAVAPYVVLNQVLMAASYSTGRVSLFELTIGSVIPAITFVTGTQVSVIGEQISRKAYRQERIIDAQRELIDRLQRAEVQRQVAERSRDLSYALLRLTDAPSAPSRLLPGEIIEGRYKIIRSLGAGGMGQVHEVERRTDYRRLALKVMTAAADRKALARFAQEARLAAALDHRNVVPVLDIGFTTGGMLFLIMELVAGGSLAAKKARFGDARWAVPILVQIADALVAMHVRDIVHRDLKPSNILLDGDLVKVADFGLACLVPGALGETAAALTRTGALMGTPLYMAPELIQGAQVASVQSDVFAAGVIAYELLSGKLPYAVPPVLDRIAGRNPDPALPLARITPELPRDLTDLIDRCIAYVPEDRPTADALAAGFRRVSA